MSIFGKDRYLKFLHNDLLRAKKWLKVNYYGSVPASKITLRIKCLVSVDCVYVYVLCLNFIMSHFYENNQIFITENNTRHIIQEFKNRIMGEKKDNLSRPTAVPRLFLD